MFEPVPFRSGSFFKRPCPMSDLQHVIQEFSKTRQALSQDFYATHRAHDYLSLHSLAADKAVQALARLADLPSSLCLVAVGGYGREELFPHSDIDLMVLLPEPSDDTLKAKLEEFLLSLWNLKLSVGHSVRTLEQALGEAAGDITVQTALLDARLIAGNRSLFNDFCERFACAVRPKAFFKDKSSELYQRHHKFNDTAYSLEPNIKESPGGLRDLQTVFWCAQAAGLGHDLVQLQHSGVITQSEQRALENDLDELKRLRIMLQLLTDRAENQLVFDIQPTLAQALGYQDSALQRASEALMRRYYRTAKSVYQLSLMLRQMLQERLFDDTQVRHIPLDKTFFRFGYVLDVSSIDAFSQDKGGLLRAFYWLESVPELKQMGATLLRALWHARNDIDEAFCNDEQNLEMFLRIIQLEHGVSHALINMNRWGILERFIAPFHHLVGQMQHDLFHDFTVDQHSLLTVQNIRFLHQSEYAHEYPLCSQLVNNFAQAWRLVLAALLHDIGKGRGGHHERVGAQIAKTICERFHMQDKDRDLIVFLIENHLNMSQVAQKQDISDPEVILSFARQVGTLERLDALYLLTVSDIRATGSKVWTNWKRQLLESLYFSTRSVLSGEHSCKVDTLMSERQKQAFERILSLGIDEKACRQFWRELGVEYFLRENIEDIVWHAQNLVGELQSEEPIVRARRLPRNAGLELMIYVPDQTALFARILAYLQRSRFSVLDARIYTIGNAHAFDTFVVYDKGERDDADLIERVQTQLTDWLKAHEPLPSTKRYRLPRRSKFFPLTPIVKIRPDATRACYLLNVTCTDRLGLLYDIALTLKDFGINLKTAKISTMGERVEDVFLINGDALGDLKQTVELEKRLIDVLTPDVGN